LNDEGEGKLKKEEAEKAIRYLFGQWRKETGIRPRTEHQPSFSEFYSWVQSNYSSYLDFKCRIGVPDQVELWFDQEFKQGWRN